MPCALATLNGNFVSAMHVPGASFQPNNMEKLASNGPSIDIHFSWHHDPYPVAEADSYFQGGDPGDFSHP